MCHYDINLKIWQHTFSYAIVSLAYENHCELHIILVH